MTQPLTCQPGAGTQDPNVGHDFGLLANIWVRYEQGNPAASLEHHVGSLDIFMQS